MPLALSPHQVKPNIALRHHIQHTTRYTYSAPVSLNQTVVRLQPRTDSAQRLVEFEMHCAPTPSRHTYCTDLHGNIRHWFWFENEHNTLELTTHAIVDCVSENPFDFILVDPGVENIPVEYREPVCDASAHYLQRQTNEPNVNQFVEKILQQSGTRTLAFLWELTSALHSQLEYIHRPVGAPWNPGETLAAGQASCRDAAVLFVDCCRVAGLASRFVSGYAIDAVNDDERELHAWGEVYLPGGGWKGYDPTTGMAVSNRHIAVAAAPTADYASPFFGTFSGPAVESTLTFDLQIQGQAFTTQPKEEAVYRWG